MNKLLIVASLFLISHIHMNAMVAPKKGENMPKRGNVSTQREKTKKPLNWPSDNPAEIYGNDRLVTDDKDKKFSKYIFPMSLDDFNSDTIQGKIKALNDFLGFQFRRIIFEKENDKIIAILNLVELSDTNTGEEILTPFHRVEIPTGKEDILRGSLKTRLIESRLQQLKDKALAYTVESHTHSPLYYFLYTVRSKVENNLAEHVNNSLFLPIAQFIQTYLSHNPNVAIEKKIKALETKIILQNPVLEKIDDLNIIKDQLTKVRFKKTEKEEEFINHMERTAEFLAAKERK